MNTTHTDLNTTIDGPCRRVAAAPQKNQTLHLRLGVYRLWMLPESIHMVKASGDADDSAISASQKRAIDPLTKLCRHPERQCCWIEGLLMLTANCRWNYSYFRTSTPIVFTFFYISFHPLERLLQEFSRFPFPFFSLFIRSSTPVVFLFSFTFPSF